MKLLLVLALAVAVAFAAPLEEEKHVDAHEAASERAAPADPAKHDHHDDHHGDHHEGEHDDHEDEEKLPKLVDLSAPHHAYIDPFNAVKLHVPDAHPDSAVVTLYSGRGGPHEYVPIQVKLEKQELPLVRTLATPAWDPTWGHWGQWGHAYFPAVLSR